MLSLKKRLAVRPAGTESRGGIRPLRILRRTGHCNATAVAKDAGSHQPEKTVTHDKPPPADKADTLASPCAQHSTVNLPEKANNNMTSSSSASVRPLPEFFQGLPAEERAFLDQCLREELASMSPEKYVKEYFIAMAGGSHTGGDREDKPRGHMRRGDTDIDTGAGVGVGGFRRALYDDPTEPREPPFRLHLSQGGDTRSVPQGLVAHLFRGGAPPLYDEPPDAVGQPAAGVSVAPRVGGGDSTIISCNITSKASPKRDNNGKSTLFAIVMTRITAAFSSCSCTCRHTSQAAIESETELDFSADLPCGQSGVVAFGAEQAAAGRHVCEVVAQYSQAAEQAQLRGNPRHIKSTGAPPKFQLRKPRLRADLDLERRHLTAVLHEPSLTGMQFSGDLMRLRQVLSCLRVPLTVIQQPGDNHCFFHCLAERLREQSGGLISPSPLELKRIILRDGTMVAGRPADSFQPAVPKRAGGTSIDGGTGVAHSAWLEAADMAKRGSSRGISLCVGVSCVVIVFDRTNRRLATYFYRPGDYRLGHEVFDCQSEAFDERSTMILLNHENHHFDYICRRGATQEAFLSDWWAHLFRGGAPPLYHEPRHAVGQPPAGVSVAARVGGGDSTIISCNITSKASPKRDNNGKSTLFAIVMTRITAAFSSCSCTCRHTSQAAIESETELDFSADLP
ncbi:unnamed protein product [Vitrella brassicaformis CCMP3155]|uniref:OTU domain-containing protein n=1 Tax=Vitrella brassicaformis (strain CCMP3155) TaxID=1169540 RepID=A0A0G4GZY7_VITBC|nr:unnamed protein product [Vitrella brassicaformis CCMP3155]|eukprot:CEM36855.1 unnamed protein product [Vitrella brassicaformis CCMP3155]